MKYIDVQGFQHKNSNFICKEIAIYDYETGNIYHKIVSLPIPYDCLSDEFKNQVLWLTVNFHGLEWCSQNETLLPYEKLSEFISNHLRKDSIILCKGVEKRNWLYKIHNREALDLLTLNCPKMKDLKKSFAKECHPCSSHIGFNKQCALQNVKILHHWYTGMQKSFRNNS